jgi:hypothetical protein
MLALDQRNEPRRQIRSTLVADRINAPSGIVAEAGFSSMQPLSVVRQG